MTYCTQPFIILADTKHGPTRETRCNPASAMCLADDWAEAGFSNVRIVDFNGTERDRPHFRETLKLVKQAKRRALALA